MLLLVIWALVGLMLVGIAYAVHNKKHYSLLSGYGAYTEEEKMELERNGYHKVMGRLLWGMAILWLISIPFVGFMVPYSIEVFIGIFLLYMMIGTLYTTRFDIPRKRKRDRIIISVTFTIVIVGMSILFYYGEKQTEVTISDQSIEMVGMYDDHIKISDIKEVKMIHSLPRDTIKSNGFATETRSLGSFHSKKFGSGRHHVFTKYPPYIFIETDDKYYILNSKDQKETQNWFEQINKSVSSQKEYK